MRRYHHAIYVIIIFAALLTSISLAQNEKLTTTLLSLLHDEDFLALTPWSTSDVDLLCVFSQDAKATKDDRESLPTRRMSVYRKGGGTLTKIYEAKTADWFLSAYPTREDGRLLVIWGGGSAYHIRVYAYLNGGVREVLDKGSRDMPEVLFDDKGRESVLLTSPEMVNGNWENSGGTTSVFKWNGTSFDETGTVPWARRFQCVSSDPCLSSK